MEARRILIVDDVGANRRLLTAMLEASGYIAIEAADGEEALEVLRRTKVDAVLSAVLMPRMDGFRLCYELRKSSAFALLPFIFVAANYASPNDEKLAMEIGADRMLKKPLSSRDVLAALAELFADPRSAEPRGVLAATELDVVKGYGDALVAKLEEKNAELQLRTDELKKLTSAVEQTADTIVITDRQGVIEYVNPAFERVTGFTREFATGKRPAILKSGAHGQEFYKELWDTILSGRVFSGEFVNRKANGELYYEQHTISPVFDADGAIVSFIAAGKDISERKRADEEIRSAHRQLKELLEHSPAMIYSLRLEDRRAMLSAVSENISRLLGVSPAEATRREWWASHLHPADRDRAIASIAETVARGTLTCEYRLRHRDGRYVWVQDSRRLVQGADADGPEIAGVWTDITERRRIDEIHRESDRRLREMLENLELIAITLDLDGKMTFCNDYLLDLTGWKREDVLMRDWFAQFVPEEHPEVRETFFRHIKIGTIPHHFENAILTKRGIRRQIYWNNTVLRDSTGAVVGTASIGEDITDRRQSELALVESRERFRQLTESIHEVFWLAEPRKHAVLYVSPAYEAVWGRTVESLYADPNAWSDAIHPDDRERILEALRQKQALGTYDEEYRLVRPDGTIRWVRDRAFPVKDESGAVHRIAGVAEDITDRKRAEQALREGEEQFRLITENVADLIALHDVDGKRLYNSPSYAFLYGDTKSLVGTEPFGEIHPDDREQIQEIFRDTVRTGVGHRAEFRIIARDGSVHMIESQGSAIRDEEGKVTRVIVVSRDVTEKKKLESQFLRSQRMESIGVLAGGIAHDLNNVLAPILMAVDILKRKFTDPASQKLLQTLESSALRGSGMIKQVLMFARGLEGERAPLQLGHIIREMERIIHETFPKSIRLRTEIPRDLWTVSGDVTQIHQVLLNLCVNARDAMPEGGEIHIKVENLMVDESYAKMQKDEAVGPYVVLSVADTGTGMPPRVMEKIFEPFYTTKEVGKGTGLGLSTVQSIVKSHGGTIKVYSEERRGTTFRIHIPAHDRPIDDGADPTLKESIVGSGELILVVDDEASIRDIARITLESYGYNVITAGDGTEAIARYIEHKSSVALVITDMMMPVMDGRATIRVFLRMNPDLKIIATSGLLAEEKALEYAQLATSAFLMKPYTARTLLKTVAEVLGKTKPA